MMLSRVTAPTPTPAPIPRRPPKKGVVFKPGTMIRFLPERCRVMISKTFELILKTPRKAFREPPKPTHIDPWEYRRQIGVYDDSVRFRMTPQLQGMRLKRLLANEPIYMTVTETGDGWEPRDVNGNKVQYEHVIHDSEFLSGTPREAVGNELLAKYTNGRIQAVAKLKQDLSAYRIEHRQWELDLISTEWSSGNRGILHNKFIAADIRHAREFVEEENAKDRKGEYDETVTGQPVAITQREEEKKSRKRKRITEVPGEEYCVDDVEKAPKTWMNHREPPGALHQAILSGDRRFRKKPKNMML
jgi:hypothetical protein